MSVLMVLKRFHFAALTNCLQCKHTWIKPEGYNTNINVYNCTVRDKVPLIVRNKNCVTWYTCGPTVYDSAHIGHASCYIKLDIIQRILRNYFKMNVVTVMNITDVDDKIINISLISKVPYSEVAKKYQIEFWNDLKSLNIMIPNIVMNVTDNISVILNFIKTLVDNGKAYESNGSVYFDLNKYDNYGKLQNIGTQETKSEDKKNSNDFVLWKKAKVGEPLWDSEWGPGRPGWHVECSALAGTIFGNCIDIHAGGIDLRFPHHENEEAQSCAHFDTNQWVNYWLHTGHLHLKQHEKMSKSLKNTISIQEMLKTVSPDVFKMACLMSHYRSNMEYSSEFMQIAESYIKKIKSFLENCSAYVRGLMPNANINQSELFHHISDAVNQIDLSLKDDFTTAKVVTIVMDIIDITNKMLHDMSENNPSVNFNNNGSVIAVANFVQDTFNIFGLNVKYTKDQSGINNDEHLVNVLDLLTDFRKDVRNQALQNKDSALLTLCDKIRKDLKLYGVNIKDHGKLSSWSK